MPLNPSAQRSQSPIKILTQILLLQLFYYVFGTILIFFTALAAGRPFSADLVLNWRSLRGDTAVGWTLGLCWMLDTFLGVLVLLVLISRSKLVPDFALTLHFFHLVVTSMYSHAIPTNVLWWALQSASAGLMTVLGMWACRWRELRPIRFGGGGAGVANAAGHGTGGKMEDEDGGWGRGRGRGREGGRDRGRDGGGEYEMVGMKGNGDGG